MNGKVETNQESQKAMKKRFLCNQLERMEKALSGLDKTTWGSEHVHWETTIKVYDFLFHLFACLDGSVHKENKFISIDTVDLKEKLLHLVPQISIEDPEQHSSTEEKLLPNFRIVLLSIFAEKEWPVIFKEHILQHLFESEKYTNVFDDEAFSEVFNESLFAENTSDLKTYYEASNIHPDAESTHDLETYYEASNIHPDAESTHDLETYYEASTIHPDARNTRDNLATDSLSTGYVSPAEEPFCDDDTKSGDTSQRTNSQTQLRGLKDDLFQDLPGKLKSKLHKMIPPTNKINEKSHEQSVESCSQGSFSADCGSPEIFPVVREKLLNDFKMSKELRSAVHREVVKVLSQVITRSEHTEAIKTISLNERPARLKAFLQIFLKDISQILSRSLPIVVKKEILSFNPSLETMQYVSNLTRKQFKDCLMLLQETHRDALINSFEQTRSAIEDPIVTDSEEAGPSLRSIYNSIKHFDVLITFSQQSGRTSEAIIRFQNLNLLPSLKYAFIEASAWARFILNLPEMLPKLKKKKSNVSQNINTSSGLNQKGRMNGLKLLLKCSEKSINRSEESEGSQKNQHCEDALRYMMICIDPSLQMVRTKGFTPAITWPDACTKDYFVENNNLEVLSENERNLTIAFEKLKDCLTKKLSGSDKSLNSLWNKYKHHSGFENAAQHLDRLKNSIKVVEDWVKCITNLYSDKENGHNITA